MKTYIITIHTDESKIAYLRSSAKLFNVPIGHLCLPRWEGFKSKMLAIKSIVKQFSEHDIVAFIDGYDMLINSGIDELVDKFLSYECGLLIGAELNCWPPHMKTQMDAIQPGNLKNKYINAGGYIGYVKDIKKMISWKTTEELISICSNEVGDDQAYLTKYYLENHADLEIKLDSGSMIFQNMHWVSWTDIGFRNGRVYNKMLDSYPCFLHFNGGSLQQHDGQSIMPVFIEKLRACQGNTSLVDDLDGYRQIITETCFPHSQV